MLTMTGMNGMKKKLANFDNGFHSIHSDSALYFFFPPSFSPSFLPSLLLSFHSPSLLPSFLPSLTPFPHPPSLPPSLPFPQGLLHSKPGSLWPGSSGAAWDRRTTPHCGRFPDPGDKGQTSGPLQAGTMSPRLLRPTHCVHH